MSGPGGVQFADSAWDDLGAQTQASRQKYETYILKTEVAGEREVEQLRKGDGRYTAATHAIRQAAARLKKRSEFLDVLASSLPEDMSILGPKAYDALMQFVVDASR